MVGQLQYILDAFHDLLFVLNTDGVIKDYISTNHEDELVLPKEAFLGKNHRDILPPKVSKKIDIAFDKLDKGKEQYRFDYSLKVKGEMQWYNTVLSKIDNGDKPKYLAVVRNITDRKNQELLLHRILNSSSGGIIVLKAKRNAEGAIIDFEVTHMNKSVEVITGTPKKELMGKRIAPLMAGSAKEKVINQFKTVIATGNPAEFQYQDRNEQDQVRWYHCKTAKYRDGVVNTFLDITKQKKTEENLAAKNERLQELNLQKNKLFSVICHDLRNAVAGAKGVYDMILKGSKKLSKNEIFDSLQVLDQRTNNTHKLLEDLLAWSRNQFQEVTTDLKKLHLSRLTDITLDSIRSAAESKEIVLINQIPDTIYVHADADMTKIVMRNLVTNGIKFSNPCDEITVTAERINQEIKVSITDEGVGMDEETQEKVMNKQTNFTSQGTNGERGSGIGLDLCIDFIEKQGGKIWVDSKAGQGSTFNFTLSEYS